MTRRLRRARRALFGHLLMSVWVILPLFPVLALLWSWHLGIR